MDVKNIRKQLAKFRDEAFGRITGLLKEMGLEELCILDFSSRPPVIQENKLDGNLTLTIFLPMCTADVALASSLSKMPKAERLATPSLTKN